MHPVVALAFGLVVVWAIRRTDAHDELGWWRLAAGATGALYPYLDFLLRLLGPGAYLQLGDGLFWALPLLPFHAVIGAVALAVPSRKGFAELYVPVLAGMASSVFLALLTDDGIAPLALLWDGRLGLRIMYSFDALVLGLSVLSLVLGFIFFPFRRYMARMGLVCILLYIVSNAGFGWQARHFGYEYAEAQGVRHPIVHALPQPLSPLNWRVLVEEPGADGTGGRIHDTMVNLKRKEVLKTPPGITRAARIDALYRPRDKALWRVYDRYGTAGPDSEADRRRVQRAFAAWQATPFGWYGRYAVFDGVKPSPIDGFKATCVQFMDLRYEGARQEAAGTWLICPAGADGRARVFQPRGKEEWREMVPLASVGNA